MTGPVGQQSAAFEGHSRAADQSVAARLPLLSARQFFASLASHGCAQPPPLDTSRGADPSIFPRPAVGHERRQYQRIQYISHTEAPTSSPRLLGALYLDSG